MIDLKEKSLVIARRIFVAILVTVAAFVFYFIVRVASDSVAHRALRVDLAKNSIKNAISTMAYSSKTFIHNNKKMLNTFFNLKLKR